MDKQQAIFQLTRRLAATINNAITSSDEINIDGCGVSQDDLKLIGDDEESMKQCVKLVCARLENTVRYTLDSLLTIDEDEATHT